MGIEEFCDLVVKEAIEEVSYESERLTVTFKADNSCIYQAPCKDRVSIAVRGIVSTTLKVKPTELIGSETAMLCKLGHTQLYKDIVLEKPVDIHMNTVSTYLVNIRTISPLN